jgi:hypothetical protein
MYTMKSFYAALSSPKPQGPYLEALSEITKINHKQVKALMGDLWWQEWGEQDQTIAAQSA